MTVQLFCLETLSGLSFNLHVLGSFFVSDIRKQSFDSQYSGFFFVFLLDYFLYKYSMVNLALRFIERVILYSGKQA